jgi:hypothetical protein
MQAPRSTLFPKGDIRLKNESCYSGKNPKKESKPSQKPLTKKEKQLGITPKEGADDDNPAM